jgi:hypothetical protein
MKLAVNLTGNICKKGEDVERTIKKILCGAAVFLAAAGVVAAQQEAGANRRTIPVANDGAAPLWTIDFIKTKDNQRENFLKFVEQNWAAARQTLRAKGDVLSYRVLALPAGREAASAWDVLLLTEYANREIYNRREAIFAEVFRVLPTVPVAGMTSGRQMADILNPDGVVYTQPLSPAAEPTGPIANARAAGGEEAAARIPLENYLKAHATGDPEFIRRAFHPDAKIMSRRDGKLSQLTVEEFAARFSGRPAEDEAARRRRIESLDITGDAAAAKITLDYPAVKFTDYMSLLKIGGEWKIVNKSFDAEQKGSAARQ